MLVMHFLPKILLYIMLALIKEFVKSIVASFIAKMNVVTNKILIELIEFQPITK